MENAFDAVITWSAVVEATTGYIVNVFVAGDDPTIDIPVYTENVATGTLTATATGLCDGTYKVVITSSIGCTDTATVTVAPITPLSFLNAVSNENCGNGDGSISLQGQDGNGSPYSYSINGGASFSSFGTFSNVVLIGFPEYIICCPIKIVSSFSARNVIALVSSSLYGDICGVLIMVLNLDYINAYLLYTTQ